MGKTPNDKLPEEMQERIKADAEDATGKRFPGDAVNFEYLEYHAGYIAGATAEAEKIEQAIESALHKERNAIQVKITGMEVGYMKQIRELVKVLGFIRANGLCSESTALIDAALQQWKNGKKEVEQEPEPDTEGCPYCGSLTCTSDHK